MQEGFNGSPATPEAPFDESPVKIDSSGIQIGQRDHWKLVISFLKDKHKLNYKTFNGDWILIKLEYKEYKKKQIMDDLEENIDYFKRENEDAALKRFAYDRYGWIGEDGNYKPISNRRSSKSPRKPEPDEVKQMSHIDKGKRRLRRHLPRPLSSTKLPSPRSSIGEKMLQLNPPRPPPSLR